MENEEISCIDGNVDRLDGFAMLFSYRRKEKVFSDANCTWIPFSFENWKITRIALASHSFYTGCVGMEREANFFLPKHEHMC